MPRTAHAYLWPDIRARVAAALLTGALAIAACGGAPSRQPQPRPMAARVPVPVVEASRPDLPPAWVEIDVHAVRVGGSIRFDITGTGHNHREGQAFEDPQRWQVAARTDSGEMLQRLVNGSTRVSREPVGPVRHNLWDVSVTFSLAFTLPDDVTTVDVVVTAPGGEPETISIDVGDLAEPERKQPAEEPAKRPAERKTRTR